MSEPTATTTTAGINLHGWCADRAANFREYEQAEMAMYQTGEDRDDDIVTWVIRCLANPDCEGSGDVLAVIAEQRRA